MKKLSLTLSFLLLLNGAYQVNASDYNPNNNKNKNNNTVLYALIGAGLLATGIYIFWPSESDENMYIRCKGDLEGESSNLIKVHQFVQLFSPSEDNFGRYKLQTEKTLYIATNFLLDHDTTPNAFKKEIQTLLNKVKSGSADLRKRSERLKDQDLQPQYEDLKDQYTGVIGILQEADLYVSEHAEFFNTYVVHKSIYDNFGSMLLLSNKDEIMQEAAVFSSGEYPYSACADELDRKISRLTERYSKRAQLYPEQNAESHRLAGQLEHIRKIVKSSPEYVAEKKRKQEEDFRRDALRLEKKRFDEERAARRREEEERERQSRMAERQNEKKLAIEERGVRAQEQANQLKKKEIHIKEEMHIQEQQSCQPINLHVTIADQNDQTNGQTPQDNIYIDQFGNEYLRRYVEHNNEWILYQLPNGMLYYASTLNGYEYYRDMYGNLIERPF